ncbi:MAG: hypothetical protein AVDCRST_MAG54-210 [uncultured Actinomycetospora sp.]|uniref:Uncharacterized protein n=1 Tax=uncultured Actinomycetospora sp. TaxID=1135996 RepID=A0A6J4H4Q2_9PSEU|nr:MAG: hypothetical protein AVDCRST_MAG54-210 [uncultured Actinomycetospora sp.]
MVPSGEERARSSRARRLLPTPATPATTTAPSRSSASSTARSSASRPVNGQVRPGAGLAGGDTTVLRGRDERGQESAAARPNG